MSRVFPVLIQGERFSNSEVALNTLERLLNTYSSEGIDNGDFITDELKDGQNFTFKPIYTKSFVDLDKKVNPENETPPPYVLFPAHNLSGGQVSQGINIMFKRGYVPIAEISHQVEHHIGYNGNQGDNISGLDIFSHPQALAQCSRFIDENGLIREEFGDTADSARFISQERDGQPSLCIASAEALEHYGLTDLDIGNDKKENITRFYLCKHKSQTLNQILNQDSRHKRILVRINAKDGLVPPIINQLSLLGLNYKATYSVPNPSSKHPERTTRLAEFTYRTNTKGIEFFNPNPNDRKLSVLIPMGITEKELIDTINSEFSQTSVYGIFPQHRFSKKSTEGSVKLTHGIRRPKTSSFGKRVTARIELEQYYLNHILSGN